eukprot:8958828-Alexandrium_andersonii.AAC.1
MCIRDSTWAVLATGSMRAVLVRTYEQCRSRRRSGAAAPPAPGSDLYSGKPRVASCVGSRISQRDTDTLWPQ